jgi:hypothetical protein
VAELGCALMSAPPERPMEDSLLTRRSRQQDTFDEMSDLGNRQGNQLRLFLGALGWDA